MCRRWTYAGAALLLLTTAVMVSEARICSSVDVRNRVDAFENLRGCRVVEGFVQVLLISVGERDLPRLSFPELVEVTDYLLVYRARGLPSLGALFPNLAVIRGQSLFYNFALVVFENYNLVQVGLYSLTTIMRGGVNIYKNKNLCYVDTVDWSRLGNMQHHFGQNQNATACAAVQRCGHCADSRCWGGTADACQRRPQDGCHAECVGGCGGPAATDCVACRHVQHDGACMPACPAHSYELMGRRCMTAEECRSIPKSDINQQKECELEPSNDKPWIPYAGVCSQICPPDHHLVDDSCEPCLGHCQTSCGGGQVISITSLACAQSFRHCNRINGSLQIQLQSGDDGIARELEENLSGIEEIEGFLEVAWSESLVSLRFFRRLRAIRGRHLESGKSALVIRDNPKLERLFPWDQMDKLEILAGRLNFHDNPMLCLSEINKLQEFSRLANYTAEEVSAETNGNENICQTIDLFAEYSVINSTCVEVSWKNIVQAQRQTLIGYTVHYVEANNFDVSLDDANDDSCGENGWRVEYVITHNEKQVPGNIYHIISNLKPYTRYAFFVKTYTIAPEAEKGLSPFLYFRTHPARPSIPRSLSVLNSSSSHITLSWEPPMFHNGNLTHYIILGKLYLDNETSVIYRDFCDSPMDALAHSATVNTSASSSNALETSCCKKKICDIDGLFSQFNYIFRRMSAKVDEELCGQPNTLHSVLHSNGLFEEQGGFINSYELSELLLNTTVEAYFNSAYSPNLVIPDNIVGVKTALGLPKFIKKVSASSLTATIEHLVHYGEYSMKVVACREPYVNETDDNWFHSRCSPASLIHARTKHLETADDINSASVKIKLTDGKTFLSWDSPPNPNGLIVKYEISYRIVNDEHIPSLLCVTFSEFIQSGGLVELPNLTPGRYQVSVRATSLAGLGKFTLPQHFRIVSTVAQPNMAVIISCITLVVALVTFLGAYIWRTIKKEKQRQRLLYTIANPEYVSLGSYVEDEWEVARDKVELLKELSHGSFGTVYEGILRPVNVRCAVKTVNDKATVHQKLEFLNEASVMKAFTDAHHVVKLLGVVSKGQPPLVIMELMVNGDLKSYLRSARETVEREPTPRRIIKMAAEIADGMAYLEASKFVHRDLAARNCMVADDLTVKIGDFGMTRDIYETDYYRKESKGLVPVRWMAPESLGDGVFTSKSDVWSYGVVLWEIVTLAEQPYQGLSNEQVLQLVLAGGCLEHPALCPAFLRHLMACCWRRNANHRPTFLHVLDCLESSRLDDDDFRQVSFYHSEAGVQLRSRYDFRAHEEELVNLLADSNSSASSGEYFAPCVPAHHPPGVVHVSLPPDTMGKL